MTINKFAGWGPPPPDEIPPPTLTDRIEGALGELNTSVQDNDPAPGFEELTQSVHVLTGTVGQTGAGPELQNVTKMLAALNDTLSEGRMKPDLEPLVKGLAQLEYAVRDGTGAVIRAIEKLGGPYDPDGIEGRSRPRGK